MAPMLGHLGSGAMFLLVGLWLTFNIWGSYFSALQSKRRFQANFSYTLRQGSRVPWESIVVITCTAAGIIGELVTGCRGDWLVAKGHGQHVTMYVMFTLTYAAEAARVRGYELLPGLEYVIGVMAFISEALLLAFHNHGTSEMEMLVHHLLLYAVLANVATVAAEAFWRHSVLPSLGRAFFSLLQGTWLIHIGFILFLPDGWPGYHWDVKSAREGQLVTAVFVLHWVGVLVAMATIGVFLRWRSGMGLRSRTPVKNGQRSGEDRTKLLISSDDEL